MCIYDIVPISNPCLCRAAGVPWMCMHIATYMIAPYIVNIAPYMVHIKSLFNPCLPPPQVRLRPAWKCPRHPCIHSHPGTPTPAHPPARCASGPPGNAPATPASTHIQAHQLPPCCCSSCRIPPTPPRFPHTTNTTPFPPYHQHYPQPAVLFEVFPYRYYKRGYGPLGGEYGIIHGGAMSPPGAGWLARAVLSMLPTKVLQHIRILQKSSVAIYI